jgi:thymidylate synthase ThyX
MTITAKIVSDSVSPKGKRLTTFELTYPRFVHAELMTHRQFSRNASSSRAIPIEKMIEQVEINPATPVRWGKNGAGMQDHGVMSPAEQAVSETIWLNARDQAVKHARFMLEQDVVPHKQIVNRILEPWMHITVLVSATEYNNFFNLRCHKDAQPEIRALANEMYLAYIASSPEHVALGEWHTPYLRAQDLGPMSLHAFGKQLEELTETDYHNVVTRMGIKISVARCARVSYLTHDGKAPSIESDLKLYDRLVGSAPLHASPAEHQATPDLCYKGEFCNPHQHGNFEGWIQYRKTLDNECNDGFPIFDPRELKAE